ncbi:hypothetical protein SLEP1_g40384 [Rubroshorea leprosula]|uniref:Uncharacterized protein n=1 Tax=Rubroshorea leprosula TaxID=152421 RepID=A0AAV5L3N2_9ROSI|nr:hypothetical protein SLEP1_g40384 [Rubroshorea leprosula]
MAAFASHHCHCVVQHCSCVKRPAFALPSCWQTVSLVFEASA